MKYEMPQMLIYILNDEDIVVTSSLVNDGEDTGEEYWTDLI